MFSTDFIFIQQENLVDNQKCQAGFRQLCNKILVLKILCPLLGNFTTHIAIVWGRLVWDNDVLLPNNVNKMKLAKSLLACKAHICANTVAVTYQKTVIGH